MADIRTPTASPDKAPAKSYKIADIRDHDVTLEMEDGRVFVATLSDNVKLDDENAKRGRTAYVAFDEVGKDDAPKDAKVTRFGPRED